MATPRTNKSGVAAKAVAAEAEAEKTGVVEFEYDDEVYTVDPKGMEDLEFLEAYEDGKVLIPIRTLLGPAQWEQFRVNHKTATELAEMADAMFAKLGAEPGE